MKTDFYDDWSVTLTVHFGGERPSHPVALFLERHDASNCTCGPYMSVIPPEPCLIHDPERAYWRAKYLSEFGASPRQRFTADTNTVSL